LMLHFAQERLMGTACHARVSAGPHMFPCS
jgi:hypothetical protein